MLFAELNKFHKPLLQNCLDYKSGNVNEKITIY